MLHIARLLVLLLSVLVSRTALAQAPPPDVAPTVRLRLVSSVSLRADSTLAVRIESRRDARRRRWVASVILHVAGLAMMLGAIPGDGEEQPNQGGYALLGAGGVSLAAGHTLMYIAMFTFDRGVAVVRPNEYVPDPWQ
jgi:hypothetical protein